MATCDLGPGLNARKGRSGSPKISGRGDHKAESGRASPVLFDLGITPSLGSEALVRIGAMYSAHTLEQMRRAVGLPRGDSTDRTGRPAVCSPERGRPSQLAVDERGETAPLLSGQARELRSAARRARCPERAAEQLRPTVGKRWAARIRSDAGCLGFRPGIEPEEIDGCGEALCYDVLCHRVWDGVHVVLIHLTARLNEAVIGSNGDRVNGPLEHVIVDQAHEDFAECVACFGE